MEPKFQVGDKVISTMSNMMYGATGKVVDVLEGRGGQNFVYVVGIEFEFPETGLVSKFYEQENKEWEK